MSQGTPDYDVALDAPDPQLPAGLRDVVRRDMAWRAAFVMGVFDADGLCCHVEGELQLPLHDLALAL